MVFRMAQIQSPGKIRGREVIWTKIKSREVELGLRAGLLLLQLLLNSS